MNLPFPEINASLNGMATILLTLGFIMIRMGRIGCHRRCMVAAFIVSAVFLVTYVTSKIQAGGIHTTFGGFGAWRAIYYTMLISHVSLAMIIVPLVLRTIYLAISKKIEKHRAWARWTYPIWYYVSVTGVLVYFFLFQWFPPIATQS